MQEQRNGRYDYAERKRVRRSGREKGGHVYLPAELIGDLANEPNLWYRLGGGERGRVIVTLYTEK